MKKNKLINKIFLALSMSVMVLACSDDEDGGGGPAVSFIGLATTVEENATALTVTIPLRDGTVAVEDVLLTGTATLGTDYTFGGVTDEGLTFTIINDNVLEPNETIRITIPSAANNAHTLTIGSDCNDEGNLQVNYFAGTWTAYEDSYGPYDVTFSVDGNDPNRLNMTNFFDSGLNAYIVFDLAAGTVKFPNQRPLPDPNPPNEITASSGTFTVDACDGASMLISVTYQGGGTFNYILTRSYPY